MRFPTSKDWDAGTVLAVLRLDGKYATEGIDYRLYKDRGKDRGWEADTIETGVDLTEGIVLYRVPAVHYEPDTVWMAVIRNGRLIADKPIEGEKNG